MSTMKADAIYVYQEDEDTPIFFGHGTGKVTTTTGTSFTVTGTFSASGTWTVIPFTPRFKYGDILKWKEDDPAFDPEPIGRFMYLGQTKNDPNFIEVVCVTAAPVSDWEIGVIVPVNADELEIVE
jgi:lipoprotein-anchoring transpeptidase ErfK/SrfK